MLIEWYKVLLIDMAANVNNYISAANAAVSKNVQIRKALADSKVRYDNIGKASVNEAALDRANTAKNNARTADTVMDANTVVERQQIEADTEKDIRKIKKGARMTGMLAGGAAMLGIGAMQLNKKEEVDPTLAVIQEQIAKQQGRIDSAIADYERLSKIGENLNNKIDSQGNPSSTTDSSSSTSTSTSTSTGSGGSKPISSFQATGKKGKYTVADMTRLAEGAGFTPEQARIMGAIGMAESGGNATIDTSQTIDPGKKNEYSIGLFQVNAQAHGDKLAKLGYTEDDLRDPAKAAQVAKMVYDEVGSFKPWSVYKSGAYSQYLN